MTHDGLVESGFATVAGQAKHRSTGPERGFVPRFPLARICTASVVLVRVYGERREGSMESQGRSKGIQMGEALTPVLDLAHAGPVYMEHTPDTRLRMGTPRGGSLRVHRLQTADRIDTIVVGLRALVYMDLTLV